MSHWGQIFRDPIRHPFYVHAILCPQTNCTHIWLFVHATGHLFLQPEHQIAKEGLRSCEISCQQDCGCAARLGQRMHVLLDTPGLMKTEPFKILLNITLLAETHLCPQHTTSPQKENEPSLLKKHCLSQHISPLNKFSF